MSKEIELKARLRIRTGTSPVRRLRKEGDVPAILYGGDKENIAIAIPHNVLLKNANKEEFFSTVITLNTGGNKERAVLRAIQRHPFKPYIIHADFQRVDDKKTLTMSIPVHLVGIEECIGVRIDGGMISQIMNEIEISCLPLQLPEYLEIDVTNLHLGESVHLSEVPLPDGVKIVALSHGENQSQDSTVVTILSIRGEKDDEQDEDSATETESDPAESN